MSETGKTRRTQAQRREEAEARIIDAALELVSEKGTVAVTMAEIGTRAGYSRGLPYERFGSKENILEALLQSLIDRFYERRNRRAKAPRGLASIVSLIETYLEREDREWTSAKAMIVMLAEASLNNEKLKALVAAHNRKHLDYVKRHIAIARENGEIGSALGDDVLAILVMSCMRGIVLHSLSDPNIDPGRLKDEVIAAILAALETSNRVTSGRSKPSTGRSVARSNRRETSEA